MKEKEKIKIDIEDLDDEPAQAETTNIADELRDLGKQFADTLHTAWNSDQRIKMEEDLRQGLKNFGEELNTMFNKAKESDTGQRVREEAVKVDTSDTAKKVKNMVAQGIQWLSDELAKLSATMETADEPKQKEPPADES